jgi:hypothetical protein
MSTDADGRVRMEYVIPVRGLIGFRGQLLTETRGTALMHQIGEGYGPWAGEVTHRTTGVLVADRQGTSNGYALYSLQERSELFIGAGEDVYEGMIIGENARTEDMDVNATKEKKLTNMRTHSHDEAIRLTPPRESRSSRRSSSSAPTSWSRSRRSRSGCASESCPSTTAAAPPAASTTSAWLRGVAASGRCGRRRLAGAKWRPRGGATWRRHGAGKWLRGVAASGRCGRRHLAGAKWRPRGGATWRRHGAGEWLREVAASGRCGRRRLAGAKWRPRGGATWRRHGAGKWRPRGGAAGADWRARNFHIHTTATRGRELVAWRPSRVQSGPFGMGVRAECAPPALNRPLSVGSGSAQAPSSFRVRFWCESGNFRRVPRPGGGRAGSSPGRGSRRWRSARGVAGARLAARRPRPRRGAPALAAARPEARCPGSCGGSGSRRAPVSALPGRGPRLLRRPRPEARCPGPCGGSGSRRAPGSALPGLAAPGSAAAPARDGPPAPRCPGSRPPALAAAPARAAARGRRAIARRQGWSVASVQSIACPSTSTTPPPHRCGAKLSRRCCRT